MVFARERVSVLGKSREHVILLISFFVFLVAGIPGKKGWTWARFLRSNGSFDSLLFPESIDIKRR